MSYRASDGTRQWDGSKKVPEERMAMKMTSFARTGITPDIAGADLSYALKLQYSRWKAKDLRVTMEVTPSDVGKPQVPTRGFHWNDAKYTHEHRFDTGTKTQKYYKDGKCIHSREDEVGINAIVTDLAVDGGIVESDSYCCPSCGAISTVRELMNGCPYCKARFLMPDLFPKVTNFYFYEDDSSKVDFIRNTVIVGAVIAALYELVQCLESRQLLDFVMVPVAGLMGAFIGLMCGGFAFLGYAIYKAIQGISEVGGSKSAERKIERKMQAFDSAFSYKLFEGQLLSFLKMALFTEEPGNLACFEGTSIPERYRDLVDMSYHGTIALKGIETDDDTVKMNLGVFLRDTYYTNNHIKIKDEEIRLQVARKRSARTDAGFSIKKVECRACGGSFDASHQRICPYCHNAYDMKEHNWVITRIEK